MVAEQSTDPLAGAAMLTHQRRLLLATGVGAFLAASPGTVRASEPLGLPPLCEPSAAVVAPGGTARILVADNEIDDRLFSFGMHDGVLEQQREVPMPEKDRPRDIEALATVGNELFVVGSHSRNTKCEHKAKRQRLRWLRFDDDGNLQQVGSSELKEADWKAAMTSVTDCQETLFVAPVPAFGKETCAALVHAETNAREEACTVLNIEGAVGIPSSERIWLGLRSPLVDGRAVLLRLVKPVAELRFDGVALVDLESRGVRELAMDDGSVWGLAGPPLDRADPFILWRIPAAELVPGSSVQPAHLHEVPTSSEGLVVQHGVATIVIDGDQDKERRDRCRTAPGQVSVAVE